MSSKNRSVQSAPVRVRSGKRNEGKREARCHPLRSATSSVGPDLAAHERASRRCTRALEVDIVRAGSTEIQDDDVKSNALDQLRASRRIRRIRRARGSRHPCVDVRNAEDFGFRSFSFRAPLDGSDGARIFRVSCFDHPVGIVDLVSFAIQKYFRGATSVKGTTMTIRTEVTRNSLRPSPSARSPPPVVLRSLLAAHRPSQPQVRAARAARAATGTRVRRSLDPTNPRPRRRMP